MVPTVRTRTLTERERAALTRLVEEHQSRLRAFLSRFEAEAAVVEELLQDVFIGVLRRVEELAARPRMKRPGTFGEWPVTSCASGGGGFASSRGRPPPSSPGGSDGGSSGRCGATGFEAILAFLAGAPLLRHRTPSPY